MKRILPVLLGFLLSVLPGKLQADCFKYTTSNGQVTITGYCGSGGAVTIPNTINGYPVTSIAANAFESLTSITSVTIGTNVTNIGEAAFFFCTKLTSVTIPDSVTTIGDYAFYDCYGLAGVTIPAGVTSIGDGPFSFCTSLSAITVNTSNPDYMSVAGVLFNQSQTTLIQYPAGKVGTSYTIPNTVTSIGIDAFSDCSSLSSVTIGTNVASIGETAFYGCTSLTGVTIPKSVTNIGDGPFSFCTSLSAITVSAKTPLYTGLAGVLFDKSQTTLIQYPAGKGGTSYAMPNTVIGIGAYAFSGTSLTSLTIPNTVTTIGDYAFYGCQSLANVTIPASVTSIEYNAFLFCPSLTGVYFNGNPPTLGAYVFENDNSAATVYYNGGTAGWGTTFGGLPTALWFHPNPLILNNGPSFGVQPNRFGFIISWATNIPVVVEACTNLANPLWFPVGTNTLASGSSYFSDANWTNYPARFYRLRSP